MLEIINKIIWKDIFIILATVIPQYEFGTLR
jgi:hypothetical protein